MKSSFVKKIDGCFAAINTTLAELSDIRDELAQELADKARDQLNEEAAELDLLSDAIDDLYAHLQALDDLTISGRTVFEKEEENSE